MASKTEAYVIGHMEATHLTHSRKKITVAMENMNDAEWIWCSGEIKKLIRFWKMNMPMVQIAKELERTGISCLMMVLDLIDQEKIEPRNWKIW
ncbi:hypothetical protein WKH57_15340 [Niallia taxi]|uniref:hypothetical protein n=1 Tax=Niallia taxi TaxID=2499688 RepID=UPI00317E67D6